MGRLLTLGETGLPLLFRIFRRDFAIMCLRDVFAQLPGLFVCLFLDSWFSREMECGRLFERALSPAPF